MKKTRGFTLIELLVVVSIIALLLSVLVPSLSKARKQARRVVCSNNLHNWGLAVNMMVADNKGKLLGTSQFGGPSPYPNHLYIQKMPFPYDKNVSLEVLNDYIKGFDFEKKTMSNVWMCPDSAADASKLFEVLLQANAWFAMPYGYFANVNKWKQFTNRAVELSDETLSGRKLLMSDAIYRWHVRKSWWFNHGTRGSSVHDIRFGKMEMTGIPAFDGANQLFGDGSVNWKRGAEFNFEGMTTGDATVPQIHIGSRPSPNVTATFW